MSRFQKLAKKLRERGYSKESADKIAAHIGDEKYGAEKMAEMSAASRREHEEHHG